MLNAKFIGNKIAEARKKLNISQAGLAERLSISSQAVGKWERGESLPDIITLNRMTQILGVELNYFSDHELGVTSAEPLQKILPVVESGKKTNKWNMSRGNWVDADFSGLKNLHEKFGSSNMQGCKFNGSDLSGLVLAKNHIKGCDFSKTNISSSHIGGSFLVNNTFKDASLRESVISDSHIESNDFEGANFTDVDFKLGVFSKNIIVNAIWNNTSFNEMVLEDITFNGSLQDCSFENCAFRKVTFQNASILNCFFKNKNLKGIRFVDCKTDRITYEFLKNGKADLSGITLLTS